MFSPMQEPDEDSLYACMRRVEKAVAILSIRVTRIETKLVKSMAQQGLDATGNPLKGHNEVLLDS